MKRVLKSKMSFWSCDHGFNPCSILMRIFFAKFVNFKNLLLFISLFPYSYGPVKSRIFPVTRILRVRYGTGLEPYGTGKYGVCNITDNGSEYGVLATGKDCSSYWNPVFSFRPRIISLLNGITDEWFHILVMLHHATINLWQNCCYADVRIGLSFFSCKSSIQKTALKDSFFSEPE